MRLGTWGKMGLVFLGVAVAGLLALADAQQPTTSPEASACEAQVSQQYQQLVADRAVQQDAQMAATSWPQQLASLGAQLRMWQIQFYEEVQTGLTTKSQKAGLQVQVRELQQMNAGLQQQLDTLKKGIPSAEK